MAELLLGFLVVLLAVAGLALGRLCGRKRTLRACGQSEADCACARAAQTRKGTS